MPAASSPEHNASFAYAPGDLIAAKYLLEELLGEGGMGAVYRARNTSLDMSVALKLLRADLNRGQLAGKLLQEARAAAKLAHPAIVRVFDVGQTALGDPFIVMELLEGETLSKLMDREGGLNPIHAVQLLLPLADALSAAHAKSLVHRDFKPDNVLLVMSDEGIVQPKLLDFAIVKSAQSDGSSSEAGSVVGSPDYMSPEQASGLDQVDARSDLWSFTVVLYELVAGATPFQAHDYSTLLRSIIQDTPPSLNRLGLADHALSTIVERGLNKNPLARYASLGQMGRALAAWLVDQGVTEDASGVSLETKWLARLSDPPEPGRKSWPPARPQQISGIRRIDVTLPEMTELPELRVGESASPPCSLTPVAESIRTTSWAPRRSWVVATTAVILALPLAWLGVSALNDVPSHDSAVVVSFDPADSPGAAPEAPPIAIASTVKRLPLRTATDDAKAEAEPSGKPPKVAAPPTPRRVAPPAPAPKKERLSDTLLAPMPY